MANGNKDSIDVLFPIGRLVQGSVHEPKTTNMEGQPLVTKSGPNAGQPRVEYFFAVAFPKTPGVQHWANEPGWGADIWAFAHKAWPGGQTQRADFAWKIIDGDSTIPDKKNVKPCDREGFPGHWVVRFGGGSAPKVVNKDGSATLADASMVKPGHFVQPFASITSNNSTQTAGLYMNHRIVAHSGYGPEINFGPDAASVGFGAAPLPAGASAVPVGGMAPPPPAGNAAPLPPAPSGATASPPPVPGAVANPPPPPVATPPANTGFVANAAAGGVAPPPPPVAAAPVRVMLPAANGATYEQMRAAGWDDATLIAHGMMQA
jgi:hypothetical protein